MIVYDSSFIYALLDRRDALHAAAASWYQRTDEDAVTSPLVIAEVDHLAVRLGPHAARAFRADLRAGAYTVEWSAELLDAAIEVLDSYANLDLGLTDASLVASAARYETHRIATFDERHFRAVRPLTGEAAFSLLPADA